MFVCVCVHALSVAILCRGHSTIQYVAFCFYCVTTFALARLVCFQSYQGVILAPVAPIECDIFLRHYLPHSRKLDGCIAKLGHFVPRIVFVVCVVGWANEKELTGF